MLVGRGTRSVEIKHPQVVDVLQLHVSYRIRDVKLDINRCKAYFTSIMPSFDESRPTIQIRIRDLRRDRRLTQEELADALGISRQSINAMEAGRTLPSLPMALQIAQFFAVPLNNVFLVDILNDGSLLPVIATELAGLWPTERQGQANLWETDRAYFVEFLVPGLRQEDLLLDVAVSSVTLSATAPRITTDCRVLSREFNAPSFTRSVSLPKEIRVDDVRAHLQGGILRVMLPKIHGSDAMQTRVEISSLD